MTSPDLSTLLAKYDVPVPRYTSYPTVPYWEISPTQQQWLSHLQQTLNAEQSSWSMYLHIPFCESLCTFCGCNTIITKDHKKEQPYIDFILKEWEYYLAQVPDFKLKPLKHLHLGGGTPTFLSAENLKRLLNPILNNVKTVVDFEASIEVDPRKTNIEHLKALREMGFSRISMGVQDFNPEVQRLINRIQPFTITEQLTDNSRKLGFSSVNFDLIYGLAKQTVESMQDTALKTVQLKPDRIALYSFALVPWIKPAQRLFKDEDLPVGTDKRRLYEVAREILLSHGYVEVGMDHFALKTDNLAKAMQTKTLHRNFMGYTDQRTDILLGLGVSSISETPYSFVQNEKLLPMYEGALQKNGLALHRGHVLTEEDQIRRQQILKLMTQFEVNFINTEQKNAAQLFLQEMIKDNLCQIKEEKIVMTEKGRPFLRNICVFFDERLKKKQPNAPLFSKSI